MKLQKAFFLVLGLAFLVSLGSLVSSGSNQKAQVVSNTNSIRLNNPTVNSTVSPGQTLPMTCSITTAPGYYVSSLSFGYKTSLTSPTTLFVPLVTNLNTTNSAGDQIRNVTVPSSAANSLIFDCYAEFRNDSLYAGGLRQLASNFPVNVSSTPVSGSDTTPPSTPTNIVSNPVTSHSINLNWNPSTDNVGVVSYKIYRNRMNGNSSAVDMENPLTVVNTPSYANMGLLSNLQYRYVIVAVDAAGNESSPSAEYRINTLSVQPPTNVTISDNTTSSLTLRWNAPTSGDVYQYAIYANNGGITALNTSTHIAVVSYDQPRYTHEGLNPLKT